MAFKFALPTPAPCADCGDGAIFHGFTYATILIDEFIFSFFPQASKPSILKKWMNAFENAVGPAVLTFFVHIGWAKKVTTPDEETLLLAKVLWEEAVIRGIDMWEWRLFGLARNVFVATYPNGARVAFEGIPLDPTMPEHAPWMDDKAKLKSEFMARGIAVAKGGCASSEKEARSIFRTLTPPVIVKPHSGSGSRHTILHISSEEELAGAFQIAKQVSPKVIIEEELVGPVYRATVVQGKLAGVIRRDPPSVVGDGVHTIAELVKEENTKSARNGPYFSKIQLTEQAEKELVWQHLTLERVPPKGQRVHFHQKVNWSVGGTTADVTDEVHPDTIELFEKAARELTAPVVGHDFIIEDITRSWKEQPRSGMLECNSMPFFDNHHLPFEGKPRNVAGAIWDMVTPK